MIGFYSLIVLATGFCLFFTPYFISTSYCSYRTEPKHHVTDRALSLGEVIRWSIITVILTVAFLYGVWGLKDAIFSKLGYLC